MGIILLVILILLIVGAAPQWPYARTWGGGYAPMGGLGLVLVVILMLLLLGFIPHGF